MVLLSRFIVWTSLTLILVSCSITDLFTRQDENNSPNQTPLVFENTHDGNPRLPEFGEDSLFPPQHFILKYDPIAEVASPVGKGKASWYGPNFHGNLTASGERYDMYELTAAHPSLPFNTRLWVENKNNGHAVMVRVNDRGPYANNRILDLSRRAAEELDMIGTGTADVRLYRIKKEIYSQPLSEASFTIQLGIFDRGDKAFAYASKVQNARIEVIQYKGRTNFGVFYGLFKSRKRPLSYNVNLDKKI